MRVGVESAPSLTHLEKQFRDALERALLYFLGDDLDPTDVAVAYSTQLAPKQLEVVIPLRAIDEESFLRASSQMTVFLHTQGHTARKEPYRWGEVSDEQGENSGWVATWIVADISRFANLS